MKGHRPPLIALAGLCLLWLLEISTGRAAASPVPLRVLGNGGSEVEARTLPPSNGLHRRNRKTSHLTFKNPRIGPPSSRKADELLARFSPRQEPDPAVADREVPGYSAANATLTLLNLLTGDGSGYDASTRPGFGSGKPTPVRAQLNINNLYDVDPATSTFTIDLRLRLYWVDPRLVVSPDDFPATNGSEYRVIGANWLGNGYGATNLVWTPDIFFQNEVNPVVLDEMVKIEPYAGNVFWSRHFLVQLTEKYFFGNFPFDHQVLSLNLTSYSYNEDQMSIDWHESGPVFPNVETESFTQVQWDVRGWSIGRSRYLQHNGGVPYEMISFNMNVSRKTGAYYLNAFMPLALLVGLTCVSYYLSVEAVPERLGLTITLVLTIVSFYSSVTTGLPPVNYATTMDAYVFVSFIIAFFSLCEVAIIHHLIKRQGNHILASELDFFCRRFVLPFWCLFNVAVLVQLPKGSFPWLWIVCGALMFLLLVGNIWLMAYYVWKRYELRVELEKSAYGREQLEEFGEYVVGQINIGVPGSLRRRIHDWLVAITDRMFRMLHIGIPGEKVLRSIPVDVDGDGKPDVMELHPVETERDRIDRRSLELDLARARAAQERRMSIVSGEPGSPTSFLETPRQSAISLTIEGDGKDDVIKDEEDQAAGVADHLLGATNR